jgi:hypothetical protein
MISDDPSYDSSFLNGKQLFSGFGIIIAGLAYPIIDMLIFFKKKRN